MREIEFRAVTENGIFIVPSESFSLSICDTGHDLVMWGSDGIVDSFPVLSMDQFTGLRDKNGEKIYEGDVVHLQWIHNYKGSIEFCHGTFCMVSAEKEIIVRTLGELYAHNISVIGNIHQHPHLLEQKK